jgi:hypothetical protein
MRYSRSKPEETSLCKRFRDFQIGNKEPGYLHGFMVSRFAAMLSVSSASLSMLRCIVYILREASVKNQSIGEHRSVQY